MHTAHRFKHRCTNNVLECTKRPAIVFRLPVRKAHVKQRVFSPFSWIEEISIVTTVSHHALSYKIRTGEMCASHILIKAVSERMRVKRDITFHPTSGNTTA